MLLREDRLYFFIKRQSVKNLVDVRRNSQADKKVVPLANSIKDIVDVISRK